jgi:hypothetical protein
MDDRPLRPLSLHPEIEQLFAAAASRPPPGGAVTPELRIVEGIPADAPAPQPDSPGETERLEVVRIDARRHLSLVLDSHRRRADALAAINRVDGDESHCVREPPSPTP